MSSIESIRMWEALMASAFLRSKRDHLREREHVTVGRDRPAQQGQVVEQALGQEAGVAVAEQVGLGVALAQLLVALAHDIRQVTELRGGAVADADLRERVVQGDLAGRAGQQVLPAQHMGDLHERVVDGGDQRVERVAVGPRQGVVGHELCVEGDLTADQVVEADLALGHPEPDDAGSLLGLEELELVIGQLAAEAVVPHHLGAGGLAPRLDLVGEAVAVVGEAALTQADEHVAVELAALALLVRRMGAALERTFVPVKAEPLHHLDERVVGLPGAALLVGVLDAEHEAAAVVPGERPVVEGRTGQADVRAPGRGRGHPDTDTTAGRACRDHQRVAT